MEDNHLLVPIELAELLHATLGPLGERLKAEGHPWADLVARVLHTYRMGRDTAVANRYGMGVLSDVYLVTTMVSEQVCDFVDEITNEFGDFEAWANELNRDDEDK